MLFAHVPPVLALTFVAPVRLSAGWAPGRPATPAAPPQSHSRRPRRTMPAEWRGTGTVPHVACWQYRHICNGGPRCSDCCVGGSRTGGYGAVFAADTHTGAGLTGNHRTLATPTPHPGRRTFRRWYASAFCLASISYCVCVRVRSSAKSAMLASWRPNSARRSSAACVSG